MQLRGRELLRNRYLNKGTAFSRAERDRFGLDGLLPPAIETIDTQLVRIRHEYDQKPTDLERHVFLRLLQQRNTVLFYRFVAEHLDELLPIIYTPTVGLACQEWSRIFRREQGLYLTWPDRHRVDELLDNALGDDEIDIVVATDGERILGLGDLGIGGMGIPIGKLALYTAAGGVDPSRTLPVMLDVGTDNEVLLSDPLYLGWRHRRVRGAEYDELVDAFVAALARRFPRVLVQWEDFAQQNAHRLLERHRDAICSFNDDIQGTAAVTVAAIAAGARATGVALRDLRLVIVGAGSAGVGIARQAVRAMIADGAPEDAAMAQVWLVDRDGLLHDAMGSLADFQLPFARPQDAVRHWFDDHDRVVLERVVREVAPHALVGVTGQPGLFTEAVVRTMAAAVEHPIVLPLSNPTPRAEAIPADVVEWTGGRALIGTGSPFDPVPLPGGRSHPVAQVNNVHVFPGVGLGVVAVGARRITDRMFTVAADAVAAMAPCVQLGPGHALLPPVRQSRDVSFAVAVAVAECAIADGVAEPVGDVPRRVAATAWDPAYRELPRLG